MNMSDNTALPRTIFLIAIYVVTLILMATVFSINEKLGNIQHAIVTTTTTVP